MNLFEITVLIGVGCAIVYVVALAWRDGPPPPDAFA